MAFLLPGVLAAIFGFLAFRSRIRGVYFSILTQALTYAACLLFFRNSLLLGGNNGFTDFKFILGYDLRSPATQRGLYIATGLRCCWFIWVANGSPDQVRQGPAGHPRQREPRALHRLCRGELQAFIFVLCCAHRGAWAASFTSRRSASSTPAKWRTDKSLEAVVWVAVGGRGTLIGPIIGAIVVNALKSWATRAYPDLWLLILGGMFILVTVFMPKGIVGLPAQLRASAQPIPPPNPGRRPPRPTQPSQNWPKPNEHEQPNNSF